MTEIHALVKKHNLLKYPNVVGYSNQLMPKIVKGQKTDVKAIRIYVKKKLPKNMLKPDEIIPEEIEGVKTDVVEIGELRALQYKDKYRPSPAGVSTSRLDENASGTIGWYLIDPDGILYVISNNHVWAKENKGAKGDPLVQPGVLDGGSDKDVLFHLLDFIPIDFSGGYNYVDVAIATIDDLSNIYTAVPVVGGVIGARDPNLDEVIVKIGRSTGLTQGSVIDTSATVSITYSSGSAVFTNVFIAKGSGIIKAGDSGSPVLSTDKRFLGLAFAGSDDSSTLVGCKQSLILQYLGQRLNKTLHILTANSPDPFRTTVVYVPMQYPYTGVISMSLLIVPITALLYSIYEIYELLRREK